LTTAQTVALHDAGRRLRAGIRDLLVWAVAREAAGVDGRCTVATTGHGREDLFTGMDVSRTAGWFQVLYPIALRLTAGDDAGTVAEVRERLAAVPNNGIGYGVLRYSATDASIRSALTCTPAIAVNYMGEFGFDDLPGGDELFELCRAPYGDTEDPAGGWPYRIDVVGAMAGGRLRLELSCGAEAYRASTARRVLDAVKSRLLSLLSPVTE
jgi:non-ribosomal peptide synthase protein (TIGR01720 family)